MADGFLNGWTFKRGQNDGPPETFVNIPSVEGLSGLGQTNPLVRTTNFDSDAEEYIAGLADGSEMSVECVYAPDSSEQAAMIEDVKNKQNRNLQFECTDGTTTLKLDFNVVCLSYELAPSFDDKNMISFKFKISGDVVIS